MELDNFEFRPLTKGLGFDKTTEENQAKKKVAATPAGKISDDFPMKKQTFELADQDFVQSSAQTLNNDTPVSRSLKKMLDSLPPSVDFREDKEREKMLKGPEAPFRETPTPIYRPQLEPEVAKNRDFDITLNNSLSKAFPKEEVSKKFYHQMVTPIPKYKETPTSFASAIIDGLIILGLASLFVVSLIAITQVDIIRMLTSPQAGSRTFLEIGGLYLGVTLLYFMIARGLFGATLGDWAFDVQLGSEEERRHLMYPFQVIFRTFVILITGIFVIPLVSIGFGKDIAYYFSGLKLYCRQY